MEQAFEDIRIVDLDTRRTTWSRVHESMRVVFLRLNRAPPDMEWARLFHEERESRINPLRCGLWIEDDAISFDCLLGDVERGHIPDIQRSIDFANRRYREVLVQRESARRERHTETVNEAETLAAMRTRVRQAMGTPPLRKESAAPTPASPSPATPNPIPDVDGAGSLLAEELERRREALRAQYRAAAKSKEKSRGDD
jgi:hypothetical protein